MTLSVGLASVAALITVCNNYSFATKSPADNSSHEDQQDAGLYSYKIHQELIPKGDELEKYGDVLISIQTDDLFKKLRLHKKITLDIFAIPPEEINTSLFVREDQEDRYQVNDNNVISLLYVKEVNGELIQSEKPLFRLNLSKKLVLECLSEIDQEFFRKFKNNVLMMKVNRVIFKFI